MKANINLEYFLNISSNLEDTMNEINFCRMLPLYYVITVTCVDLFKIPYYAAPREIHIRSKICCKVIYCI